VFVLDPLHDYVVVESAPDVMQRIQFANADLPLPSQRATGKVATGAGTTGRLILPDNIASDGVGADGGTGSKGRGGAVTTLLAGRVLWVGAGKHRDGAFVVPKLKARDLVLFMPRTVSYEFRLHGRDVKILPYAEIVSSVREVPVDSREWLDFLDLAKLAMAANDAQEPAAEAV
jgi:hypothetical protein